MGFSEHHRGLRPASSPQSTIQKSSLTQYQKLPHPFSTARTPILSSGFLSWGSQTPPHSHTSASHHLPSSPHQLLFNFQTFCFPCPASLLLSHKPALLSAFSSFWTWARGAVHVGRERQFPLLNPKATSGPLLKSPAPSAGSARPLAHLLSLHPVSTVPNLQLEHKHPNTEPPKPWLWSCHIPKCSTAHPVLNLYSSSPNLYSAPGVSSHASDGSS